MGGQTAPVTQGISQNTTTIAGVTVIDTPIVRDAQAFARQHTIDSIYNHVMRSWLLSAIIINANETLRNTVDLEVHAVASLLHDIGLDPAANSPVVSPDRRFEVDGAFAARKFVEEHEIGQTWDSHRLQLLWDSIALHATFTIADYKEFEVQLVSKGAVTDFTGPVYPITQLDWDTLVAQFPRTNFGTNFNESIIHLCMNKPNTTYDNWMQPFGDRYVAGYSSKGHDLIDSPVYP
ncbi:uncharacterized protein TRIVIDRAFT_152102 [Trichoderma virens Gv29-8]|uniref:HD domain-containing protein n=1 Tax=Hypocrea virens (strain Gv29-8 / FGSC 10586) TaxID=413071 RepID=G9MVA0_HYPVG|nr:uncharacterized protein TRIVIDRAFT_152102 [Trichoderma virens Gv29-8]EHK21617.1 hypothetical protein TRIVIDRAFT_152102 [Trichoderma virens Gv29-8]UKZ51057.1 hypothetical protein TrVGV298_004812 [Trichoderma virens]